MSKGRIMRITAIGCIIILLMTGFAWAGDCAGDCGGCGSKCYPSCEQPCCAPAPQPCTHKCDSCCDFGMDAIMSGLHEIPVMDEGLWELDPSCCMDEFRLLPCREWCVDFTICCPRGEYQLLCQPECEPQCPHHKKCRQDICTPVSGCDDVDTSVGLDVG